jgi:hypothetical protein
MVLDVELKETNKVDQIHSTHKLLGVKYCK